MPLIYSMLPNPKDLLNLEPEELAGPLLISLDGSQSVNPFMVIGKDNIQGYPSEYCDKILFALMEAWQWLEREGFVAPRPTQLSESTSMGPSNQYFVTRRGQSIEKTSDLEAYRKANLLPKRQLHPVIAQKVWSLFLRGDYDTAVFQAFKEVEIAARKAGGYAEIDYGVTLMRKAFDLSSGNLTDPKQQPAEKQAMSDLFAGAIGLYKNPQSHRAVPVTAEEAVEMIIFASHLLRIVDSRKKV